MACIFWDSQAVIMVDYLEEGRMINDAYYAEVLGDCKEKKRKVDSGVLLLQDNAPAHTSKLLWLLQLNAASAFCVFSWFSTFCLFLNLKTNLHVRNLGSSKGIIDAVDEYLGDQEEGFYFEGISKLE